MKKLLFMSFISGIALGMTPKAIIFATKSDSWMFQSCKLRTFATYKGVKNNFSHRPARQWKQTHAEYMKALGDREKCKKWKQIGYGMHEGYCINKSCVCTYRLSLIAQQ